MKEPETYLSTSNGKWRAIHQGQQICADKSSKYEAQVACVQCKLTLPLLVWDGNKGCFRTDPEFPVSSSESRQRNKSDKPIKTSIDAEQWLNSLKSER